MAAETNTTDIEKGTTPEAETQPQGVQFVPADDGVKEGKVDLGYTKPQAAFVGLGKEELLKFAEDPYWVRIRWILFFLFWIVWVALLAGSVLIITLAPGCESPDSTSEFISTITTNMPFASE